MRSVMGRFQYIGWMGSAPCTSQGHRPFARIEDVQRTIEVFTLAEFPPVPLTLEGSALLHQFFRFDWKAWRRLRGRRTRTDRRRRCRGTARSWSEALEAAACRPALFSQLGHKGDLILVHFRDSLEALNQVELDLAQTALYDFLDADALVCFGRRAGPVRVEPQDV